MADALWMPNLLGGNQTALAQFLGASAVSCAGGGAASEASRGAAGAGLVSFGNKAEAVVDGSFVADLSGRMQRLRRLVRGVLHMAKGICSEMDAAGEKYRAAFITLTYAPDVDWKPSQIRDLLAHYRKWCMRRNVEFRYVWVLELTKAGRPHYHIVAWLPPGITPPLPDKQGWWPHGKTQAKWARSPVGYLAKYASKGSDGRGELPKGARLWGGGGVSKSVRGLVRWACAPAWVRFLSGDPTEPVRKRTTAKDGDSWWEFPSRGFACGSPYEFDCALGVVRWKGWTAWDVAFFDPVHGYDEAKSYECKSIH